MKSCPTCSRTYADETLTFCLIDGSILSAPYVPQAPSSISASRYTDPPPTEVLPAAPKPADTDPPLLYPTLPSPPPLVLKPETGQAHSSEKRAGKRWLVVGVVAFFVIGIGLLIILNRGARLGNNNSVTTQPSTEVSNSNAVSTVTPVATAASTPQSSPSAIEKLDVTGTWVGTFDNQYARLNIDRNEDSSFYGTLTKYKQNGYVIAVVGSIAPDRRVTIKETRVLTTPKGRSWSLGVNNGLISSDGKSMSGGGKDARGDKYSWRFSKQ
jgi:hypothetical protein